MTRNEFLENVDTFSNLIDFCDEIGSDVCCDLYYYEDLNEAILDDLREDPPRDWCELRDCLNGIPEAPYWYVRNGWLDYESADDRFDEFKQMVLDEADDNGDFDADEEEENEEEPVEEEAGEESEVSEPDPDFGACPDCQYRKLFDSAGADFVVMVDQRLEQQRKEDQAFRDAASGAIQIITQ